MGVKQAKIQCHVEAAIAVIGGKWKPWILWHLYDSVRSRGHASDKFFLVGNCSFR